MRFAVSECNRTVRIVRLDDSFYGRRRGVNKCGGDIQNNKSIIARMLVRDADGAGLIRLDVTLREFSGRRMVWNAMQMKRGIALYTVYVGMNKRSEALRQCKQK